MIALSMNDINFGDFQINLSFEDCFNEIYRKRYHIKRIMLDYRLILRL